jgi:hypothetical protein
MKPRIGIGITTYRDISSPEFGEAVFDAYAEASERITPNQVKVWSIKSIVENRDDFGRLWLTRTPYQVHEGRSRRGPVLERGEYMVGAEWKRTGALAGEGSVTFRPELERSRTNEIIINHAYSPRVDWLSFFRALVAICGPSYAMLHLFTDTELATSASGDRFEVFDGPFAGEAGFTHFRSPLGHWDGPDQLRLVERRIYKYLPELSWANFLGPEFRGNYDPQFLARKAAVCEADGDSTLFCVTPSLGDVIDRYEEFNLARVRLRAAFPPRFFHRTNIAIVRP